MVSIGPGISIGGGITITTPPPPPPVDNVFNSVTALLSADTVTPPSTNTTFVDSSTNNFTITRNGNTTQGSFSPYGSLWSNYFDGSGDYLRVADNAAFAIGTGDFTIETWIYPTVTGVFPIVSKGVAGSSGFSFALGTTNKLNFLIGSAGSGSPSIASSATVALDTWTHVAVVRSGTTITLFVNGVADGTGTFSTNLTTASILYIGIARDVVTDGTGYLSNLRLVNGTALYTTNFTPSTTPLTAVAGTSLLTCTNNTFKDASENNFTVTSVGNTTVTRFSPFELNVSYSTNTFGGSAYFDGTGDTLSIPSSTPNQFGSGDFTLETWYYCTGSISTANQYLFFRRTTASSIGLIFQINSSKLNLLAGDSNTSAWEVNLSSTTTLVVNNWYHLAMSRSGTTWRIFVNGVLEASATPASFTIAEETANITVGNNIDGFLSNWRAVKGTAVYTSNFTPPVAPVIAISGTAILLNFTNAGVFDNAMMNNYQTVGNASLSTSVVKYGNSSISFDGTGDWLNIVLTTNNLFAFRLGNFTVELWFNGNSVASGNLVDFRPASTNGAYPMIYLSGGQLRYWVNGADRITGGSLSTGTWYHIAVCRSGNSTKMFLDGIQVGSTYTDNNTYLTADVPLIGASAFFRDGSAAINGYVTDFRVSKGVARYTDNFTPPTVPLPQF